MFRVGRQRHGRGNVGIFLLLLQVVQFGIDRIPPVTLATLALNTIIHLVLQPVTPWQSVCIGVKSVWYNQDYSRLLKSAFYHADDWHLYYNMVSFLYKGYFLERRIGSKWFLYMLAVFTLSTNVLLLYLNYASATFFNDMAYLQQCAVGFSGVIFAVKVVTTYLTPPGTSYLMGFIPVNSRRACWFELALIQILVPNASFTGHLAGIIVGLAYVKGPLKPMMEFVSGIYSGVFSTSPRHAYTYSAGTAGTNDVVDPTAYTGGLDEDEQYRRAMEESMRNTHRPQHSNRLYPNLDHGSNAEPSAPNDEDFNDHNPPSYGWNIPGEHTYTPEEQEELRRRRLQRFDR